MNFSDPEFMQYVVKTLTIGQLEELYVQWYNYRITQSQVSYALRLKALVEPIEQVTKKARKRKPITLKEIKEFDAYLEVTWPK